MNTNKPLSEWTLGETREYCEAHDDCEFCDFNHPVSGCAFSKAIPAQWNLEKAKVPLTLPVQLDEGAYMPERAHRLDAGLDLRSPIGTLIPGFGCATIDTGVHIQLPPGTVGMLKSKSGLNVKHGLTGEGVIDEGFTGSIVVKLYNHTPKEYYINKGDKISQLVILPVLRPAPVQVDKIEGGERGNNGFGSTGR